MAVGGHEAVVGEGGVCVWEAWNLSGELRMEKLEFGDQHHDSGLGGSKVQKVISTEDVFQLKLT